MNTTDSTVWEKGTDPANLARPPPPPLEVARRAYLVGLSGDAVGQVFDLKEVTVIGRRVDVDLPIADTQISRNHARIQIIGGHAQLHDLGSRNGTFVNDHPVSELALKDGDQVRLGGNAVFKFVWGDELSESINRINKLTASKLDVTLGELRSAQQRLVQTEKLFAVCQLGAGIGHEILNPLSFVIHNLSFIGTEVRRLVAGSSEPTSELNSAIKDAQDGAERIRRIVSDLQGLSRHTHDEREAIDLRTVLEHAAKITAVNIEARASLVRELGDVPRVMANATRLCQVFVNLLANAADAIPEGARDRHRITIATFADRLGRAVAEVRDTGCGVPPELIRRIFDPFFTTKAVGKGMGLGLALSQGIVTALGGEILVDSEPGRDTVFRVVLPPAHRVAEAKLPDVGPTANILCVDDTERQDPGLAHALEGHQVTWFGPKAALDAIARGQRYDLILCGMLTQELKLNDFLGSLSHASTDQLRRVVFLVGDGADASHREFLNRVRYPRIRRPVDPTRLRLSIPEWLKLWED